MPSLGLTFVLTTLATWRVTHLLVAEDGPWDVVVRVRARLGNGVLGRMMDCFNCASAWVAAPLALALADDVGGWCVAWLALSGGASLLEQASTHGAATIPIVHSGGSHELLRRASSSAADAGRVASAPDGGIAGTAEPDPDYAQR